MYHSIFVFSFHIHIFVAGHIHAVSLVATAFSMVGKMAASGTFGSVFLYTPEIYPTNYRYTYIGIRQMYKHNQNVAHS